LSLLSVFVLEGTTFTQCWQNHLFCLRIAELLRVLFGGVTLECILLHYWLVKWSYSG